MILIGKQILYGYCWRVDDFIACFWSCMYAYGSWLVKYECIVYIHIIWLCIFTPFRRILIFGYRYVVFNEIFVKLDEVLSANTRSMMWNDSICWQYLGIYVSNLPNICYILFNTFRVLLFLSIRQYLRRYRIMSAWNEVIWISTRVYNNLIHYVHSFYCLLKYHKKCWCRNFRSS